jgi:choline dehydrogenase
MPDEVTFDFVVVGAGSSGCAVAEALTRDGRFTVALIEAGGTDRRFWTRIPLGYGKTFYDRSLNWAYTAEPDPGLNGRADYWPRGKILGGSSAINAMVWIRGNPRDFDDWASGGAPGWGCEDVLPWFRAIERNAAGPGPDGLRGADGPVPVSDIPVVPHPLARRFVQAGVEAGLPFWPSPEERIHL